MNTVVSLNNLLAGLRYELLNGNIDGVVINKLCYDSKVAEAKDMFVCLKGARFDSHSLINELVDKKVKVLVVEKNNEYLKDALIDVDTVVIGVENTRAALSILSANYFGRPADKLNIIGITGTKGKTTTAFMIKNILEAEGHKVGMIGTIGIYYGKEHIITDNTTPESFVLHQSFAKMLDEKCEYVVMEVSSQSLKHHRVDGIKFFYAIWTNIYPEHIGKDEHDDYDDYLNSKLKIFYQCENALVNADSNNFEEVTKTCKRCSIGMYLKNGNLSFKLLIPGDHHLENASLALRFAKLLGIKEETARKAIENTIVPGRSELVYKSDEMTIYVDYSYEPTGADKFIETIKKENPKRIVGVFGCGGNRSKDRRYGMGEVAGKKLDFVVLTADNSRYEKTLDIIADIESTLTKYKKKDDLENGYVIREDRAEAIKYAIDNHKKGDYILVMGRGHEPLQEMNGEKIKLLDRDVILKVIGE